jgi:sugar phosphate permease
LSSPVASSSGLFYGWWIVLVGFLAMFAATQTGGAGLSVFVLPMLADLGWDRKTIAGALSLGTVLGAFSAPFFGQLVDRYGARVMLTATGLGLGLTLIPIAWVQAPLAFYLLYGGARLIDMGVLNTAATTAVANWFVRRRGRALGIAVAGNAAGVMLLAPLAQLMIDGWGWRTAWLTLSVGVVALLTPLAWLLVRRRPVDLGLLPDGERETRRPVRAEPRPRQGERSWLLSAAVRTPAFWLLVGSASLTTFSIAGLSLHQVPILVGNGLPASTAAWVVSLFGLSYVVGCVSGGAIVERVPARLTLACTYGAAGLCMLAVTRIESLGLALVYAAVYGLVNGGKEALDAVVWADYYGRRSLGAIRGFSRPLVVGANAGGAVVAGWAYDSLGSYSLVMTVFGLLTLTGATLALLARPPRARPDSRFHPESDPDPLQPAARPLGLEQR